MRLVLSALICFAAATAASAATPDADIKVKIVGSWADTESCKDGSLVFNMDGTFVSKAPDGSPPDDDLKGNYTIAGGKLMGKAEAIEMPTVAIDFDGEKLLMGDPPNQDILIRCK
jgi:hypothetical protein